MSFTYYSNSSSASARPAIMVNDSAKFMMNGAYGANMGGCLYLNKGDKISAGAYTSSFPINLYAANDHNLFTVCLIKEYTL